MIPLPPLGRGFSSYRPQFFIDDRSWSTSYLVDTLVDREDTGPGETGTIEGVLLRPEMFPNLKIGDRFKLAEGPRIVAVGTVLEIKERLPPDDPSDPVSPDAEAVVQTVKKV